jgi:FAD:protein FMN transferase
MGTFLAIEAQAPTNIAALKAIDRAHAAVAEVEARMHPSRAGSDLQRINAARPGAATTIDVSTSEVLQLARHLHDLTDGIFDPCLPLLPGRLSDLELLPARGKSSPAVVCHRPLFLDLGGIAKGYAIDCAIEALRTGGCVSGLVNAGGDLRVFGAKRENLLLRRSNGDYDRLSLEDTALGVSDVDATRRPPEHQRYYVRVGTAHAPNRYAAVLAPHAVTADALTKCILFCQNHCAGVILARLGARIAARMI